MQLIHYTDRQNLEAIRKSRTLRCALSLMTDDERQVYARERREKSLPVERAVLRDQQPLCDQIHFEDNATFAEFVEYLNSHVFFWPCVDRGERYRQNFRKKYAHPEHIGLRCQLSELYEANSNVEILFSPYNSGAKPRNLTQSPRSINMFRPLRSRGECPLAEVVVKGSIVLPDSTQEECDNGEWRDFFTAGSR